MCLCVPAPDRPAWLELSAAASGQAHADEKCIVYFLTCACVDLFALLLGRLASLAPALPPVRALHGRMKQAAREATLASFAALPAGDSS